MRPILATLVASIALIAVAPAQARLTAWPEIRSALPVRLRSDSNATQWDADGKPAATSEIHNDYRIEVVGTDGKGVATLRLTYEHKWGTVTWPGGKRVEFDSASGKRPDPRVRSLLESTGKTKVITVDPRGRILAVRPLLAGGESGDEEEHSRQTMQALFAQYPDHVVEVGTTFVPAAAVHECRPTKCEELTTEFRLEAVDEGAVTFSGTAVEGTAPTAGRPAPVANEPEGTGPTTGKPEPRTGIRMRMVVSREDGLLRAATVQSRMTVNLFGADLLSTTELTISRPEQGH